MKANTADRLSNDVSPKGKVRYSVFAVVVIGALILSVALISSKDNTNEIENSDGSSSSLDAPARSIASKDQSTDIPRTALQQDSLFPMFSPTAEPPLTMEASD